MAIALTAAHAHRLEADRAVEVSRSFSRVLMMRAPVMPNGWPRAMAPPLTVELVEVDAELARTIGMHLGGEGLVELDEVDVADGHAGAASSAFFTAPIGATPMISGSLPADARCHDAGQAG